MTVRPCKPVSITPSRRASVRPRLSRAQRKEYRFRRGGVSPSGVSRGGVSRGRRGLTSDGCRGGGAVIFRVARCISGKRTLRTLPRGRSVPALGKMPGPRASGSGLAIKFVEDPPHTAGASDAADVCPDLAGADERVSGGLEGARDRILASNQRSLRAYVSQPRGRENTKFRPDWPRRSTRGGPRSRKLPAVLENSGSSLRLQIKLPNLHIRSDEVPLSPDVMLSKAYIGPQVL